MPKVSALMPVYNTNLAYLKETIESVLNQTFTDFEFLILNDSPQNIELENFILEYAKQDNRIKYFKNSRNLGISPSRNKLIDLAQGEFLAVIDHDDISVKERFEKEVAFLEANEEVGVVGGGIELMTNNQKIFPPTKNEDIVIGLMLEDSMMHQASMIRKNILQQNQIYYDAFYSPCEDYKLWCDLINFTTFANLDDIMVIYRNYDNTSQKQSKKTKKRHWAIVNLNKKKYSDFFSIATINSKIDVVTMTISEYNIRLLGIPLLKITQTDNINKIKIFGKIEILKIQKIINC